MFDGETRIADDRTKVDEEYPLEIVLGCLLNALDARVRFTCYLELWAANATAGWAVGFMPYLGLTGLGDTDSTVNDCYRTMYRSRTAKGLGWAPLSAQPKFPHECFPAAVALLLFADHDPRAPEVAELESSLVAALAAAHDYFTTNAESSIDLVNGYYGGVSEDANPAMDYLIALSLAWLHVRRQTGRGITVSTTGFPRPPDPAQLTGQTFTPRPKPAPPAPVMPPPFGRQWVFRSAVIHVGPMDGLKLTGVMVSPFDDIEIVATGQINSGAILSGDSGPEGWNELADTANYPMTGPDSRRYALIGCVGPYGSYFPVGSHFPRRTFRYENGGTLYLAVNTDNWKSGAKQFAVTINQWSYWPDVNSGLLHVLQGLDGWSLPDYYITRAAQADPNWRVTTLAAATDATTAEFLVALEDGRLLVTTRAGQSFTPAQPVPDPSGALTGYVVSAAGAGNPATATHYVVVLQDGSVRHATHHAAGAWDPFDKLPDALPNGVSFVLAAGATPPDATNTAHYVLASDNGHLWLTTHQADGTWTPATDFTPDLRLPSGGEIVALSEAGVTTEYGSMQIMFATADGALRHSTLAFGGGWAPAGDVKGQIGDIGQAVSIAASSRQPATSEFGIVTADGKVILARRQPNGSWYNPPFDMKAQELDNMPELVPMAITAVTTEEFTTSYLLSYYDLSQFGPQ